MPKKKSIASKIRGEGAFAVLNLGKGKREGAESEHALGGKEAHEGRRNDMCNPEKKEFRKRKGRFSSLSWRATRREEELSIFVDTGKKKRREGAPGKEGF